MVAITNYATLIQALKNEAENDGIEFSEFLPTAVDLAEEKLFRELELPELEEDIQNTITGGTNFIIKPLNYRITDALQIKDSNNKFVTLKKKLASFIRDYWPDETATGTPKYYADKSETQFVIAPTPASTLTYILRCVKQPSKISQTNTTNYFVNRCPDLLFYACMLELCKFMKAWSQVPVWEAKYAKAQESWNVEAMRYRRDGQITPNSPDDGPNSLKHTIQTNS